MMACSVVNPSHNVLQEDLVQSGRIVDDLLHVYGLRGDGIR